MAVATGVRADSWQTAGAEPGGGGLRAVPGERGEAVRPVGLGRPDRVEAELLGGGQQLGHADGRLGEPVPEDQAELQIVVCHGRAPYRRARHETRTCSRSGGGGAGDGLSGVGSTDVRDAEAPQRDRLIEPLEAVQPGGVEEEALALHEVAHRRRDQHVAGSSGVARPPGQLHHRAEEVVVLGQRLAGVDPDPDLERHRRLGGVVRLDRLLDVGRGLERARDRRRPRHDPVARVLHLAGPVRRGIADDAVVRRTSSCAAMSPSRVGRRWTPRCR